MRNLFLILILLTFFFGLSSISLKAQSGWTLQVNPLGVGDSALLGRVQFVSENEGWISAANGKLLHTTNKGMTWNVVSPEPVDTIFSWSDPDFSLSFINVSTGYVLRTKGSLSHWQGAVLYKTTDSGMTWHRVTIPNYDAGILVQFVDEQHGWILVFNSGYAGGGLFRTTSGGSDWNLMNLPAAGFPYFKDSNTGWLLPRTPSTSTSDTVWKTTDGGLNWTAPWGTSARVRLNSIHFSDSNNGWIVGDSGKVLHTTNGGSSWTYSTNTGLTSQYNSKAVFALNANLAWVGADRDEETPRVLRTTDGGASWEIQSTPITQEEGDDIFSMYFWDQGNGWLTADGGRVCYYSEQTNVIENTIAPQGFALYQNYPNPFNPRTTIGYQLPSESYMTLKVFSVLGNEVITLVNGKQQPGRWSVSFDAGGLPSGVYYYRLQAGSYNETKKLILVK